MWKVPGGIRLNEFFLGVSVQHIQRLALANETYRQRQGAVRLARVPARSSVLTHSFASRFCDGERFFGSAVLCEDGFGAGGPLEGLWVLVSMLDPLVNRNLEFDDVVEGSSSDALASDFGEEPLDEVEPGTGCRREVQCEAFVSRQPALRGRRLVGGVVVEDLRPSDHGRRTLRARAMQRSAGQYDRVARIPGTGPRQSSGRGPFAPGYRCRATARPARGMEPTVRSARTQIRLIEKNG